MKRTGVIILILSIIIIVLGLLFYKGLIFGPEREIKEELVYTLDSIDYEAREWTDDLYPNFFFSSNQKNLSLPDYREGNEMILNFWTCYCPPSIGQIAELEKVKEKYEDIKILTVNVKDKDEVLEKFIQGDLTAHPDISKIAPYWREAFDPD